MEDNTMVTLSLDDAMYVQQLETVGDLNAGVWFKLSDLAGLEESEIYYQFKEAGLSKDLSGDSIVVTDYEDFTGIGYEDLFEEPHPLRVLMFYEEFIVANDSDLEVFIAVRLTEGPEEALEALENNQLAKYDVVEENDLEGVLDLDVTFAISEDNKEFIIAFMDVDKFINDLEAKYGDQEDGPFVDEEMLQDMVEVQSAKHLAEFFDYDEYKKNVIGYGYYKPFSYEGSNYYLYKK
jgi:hypothetical protein